MFRIKFLAVLLAAVSIGVAGCGLKKAEDEGDDPSFFVPQSPLLSALERKVGLIAYIGADGNVYTVNQSGQNPVQITDDAKLREGDFRYYEFPAWAPDGKTLAFYSLEGDGQTRLDTAVYTADAEGKNVVEAYSSDRHVPVYLMWSPDSSQLTFIASILGGNNLVLNMIPAAGGETQVLDVGAPFYWDWLSDSSGVIVHSGGQSAQASEDRLAMLTFADGVVEDTLALTPAPFQSPALSPDGLKLLLAIEGADGENTLAVTDRLGKVENEIATLDGPAAFAWSPDGTRVAYIVGDPDREVTIGKLKVVELGEEPKTVETDQDQVLAFFWSPDGKQIAYFNVALFTPEPDPEAPEGDVLQESQPYLKLYVADAASGKGKRLFSLAPPQDFWRMLQYFDQYSRSTTIWSPDSQNLVVPTYLDAETPAILVVPASGVTTPRFLQPGLVAFWSAK
jgi:TolB protein